jgi:flagellar biosynthesis protein FliQ
MDMETALDLGREAVLVALTVSSPVLGIGLIVGVLISLFQAVTQLQEQTLSFVPKILAMAVATILFVPWIANRLVEYTQSMLGTSPF